MTIILIYLTFFTFFVDQVTAGFGVNLPKGLSVFNLCLYFLLVVWSVRIVKRKEIFLKNNINFILGLLCLIVFLSIFTKIFHAEIQLRVVQEIIAFKRWLNPILLFWILFNILDTEVENRWILYGLAVFYFAVIVSQYLAIQGVIDYQKDIIEKIGRVGGLGAAGEYAIMLTLFFPFSLSAAFFLEKNSVVKTLFILLSLFMLMGYVNAGSRNGALSLVIAVTLYFILIHRFLFVKVFWLFFLFIFLMGTGYVCFLFAPQYVQESVTGKFEIEKDQDLKSYSSGRTQIWANGWELILESPIFGHGQNTFIPLLKKRGHPTYAPHNEYLKHLQEYGLVGFTVFLLLYLKIVHQIWSALKVTTIRSRKVIYSSYFAGLLGYMVGMFFTNTGVSLYIFWSYTAIIYKYIQMENLEKLTENRLMGS